MKRFIAILVAAIPLSCLDAEGYFQGTGGKGESISVESPKMQNVGDDVSWLPDYVNNVISDDVKKYSQIEVVEQRYENAVVSALAREEGGEYEYDDGEDTVNFKRARNQLQVTIIGKGTNYNVSASVVDKATLTSRASFNENCDYQSLNSGAVLGKAVESLLEQLGVILTSKAKDELLASSKAVTNQSIEAQKIAAKALAAQAQGANMEAMRFFS